MSRKEEGEKPEHWPLAWSRTLHEARGDERWFSFTEVSETNRRAEPHGEEGQEEEEEEEEEKPGSVSRGLSKKKRKPTNN